MSVAEIKNEMKTLSKTERQEITSFLTLLNLENDEEHWKTVKQRLDDTNPQSWISLEELQKKENSGV